MDNGAATREGSAVTGFFILAGSFFTMPLKTLKTTLQELRAVGGRGKLEDGSASIPHLAWLQMAGHIVTSAVLVVIFALGIARGLEAFFRLSHYSMGDALVRLTAYSLAGVLMAVLADWFMAIAIELSGLWIGIANDIRKMSQK